jgi:hypothetical protein
MQKIAKITVPNINSSDMNERIAARRARITVRNEKRKMKEQGLESGNRTFSCGL